MEAAFQSTVRNRVSLKGARSQETFFLSEHNLNRSSFKICKTLDSSFSAVAKKCYRDFWPRDACISGREKFDEGFASMEKRGKFNFDRITFCHQRFLCPNTFQEEPRPFRSPKTKKHESTPSERCRNPSASDPAAEMHIETASRWLFMSVKWAKSLPYFAELYYPDQLELLRQNWSKLFLFNLLFFEMIPKSVGSADDVSGALKDVLLRWSEANLKPEIPGKIEQSIEKLRRLHMDETETLLMKSLLLFNPETEGLVDASQVQVTQNKCHRALEEHTASRSPDERDRSGRILLTVLTLTTFEERDIEAIFLSTVLGNATVTSLMENILCADAM